MRWQAGTFEFTFPRPALIMGVLNVTPDSFSDGGAYHDPAAAIRRAEEMAASGADIIDVGGESTRPNATPVPEEEELRRVLPVLKELKTRLAIPISIDTQKPGVAKTAAAHGASIINDIAANRTDPEMWRIATETGCGYVAMHMRGTPQTMQSAPRYEDVVREIEQFFTDRLDKLREAGVKEDQIVFDAGIGFGKGLEDNLELINQLERFKKLERPLLLGVSRKSFIGKLLGVEVHERVAAGLACALWAVRAGVQVIRTHDVAETWQAVRMYEAIELRRRHGPGIANPE